MEAIKLELLTSDRDKFDFHNLDEKTRQLMLEEIVTDLEDNRLYFSERFNAKGRSLYPGLLWKAAESGDEQTLAYDLLNSNCFKDTEARSTKHGVVFADVPYNAHIMFASGEFNKFYIRALCARASDEGKKLFIYRAKPSEHPRPFSESKIGKVIDPEELLNDLRQYTDNTNRLGIPSGPNSGLSVEML